VSFDTALDLPPNSARFIAAGDLDNDSDLDLVVSTHAGTAHYLLNNGPSGPFSGLDIEHQLEQGEPRHSVAPADVNDDGWLDILVGSFNGRNQLYINKGGALPFDGVSAVDIGSETDFTTELQAADIDGDGLLDVVVVNTNQQTNKI